MMGLKNYYVEKKDTAKANAVDDIIKFEESVTYALGKRIKVTEEVKVTPIEEQKVETSEKKTDKPYFLKDANKPAKVEEKEKKEEAKSQVTQTNENTETTFTPLPSDGNSIPVLTPLPKAKSKITSPFGMRMHPTLHRLIKHNGVDFGSGRNAEVYASANGKVVLAEYNRSFGNYIIVEHKDGTSSLYAHLESIATSKGRAVKKGDLIGHTGSTGRSSGPHLHYEVRVSGIPVNPEGYLKEVKP
jgi:murein DD-endopeptidase MepM/ murein hydrolase activator NlpD